MGNTSVETTVFWKGSHWEYEMAAGKEIYMAALLEQLMGG